jgi:hypothetical protein
MLLCLFLLSTLPLPFAFTLTLTLPSKSFLLVPRVVRILRLRTLLSRLGSSSAVRQHFSLFGMLSLLSSFLRGSHTSQLTSFGILPFFTHAHSYPTWFDISIAQYYRGFLSSDSLRSYVHFGLCT